MIPNRIVLDTNVCLDLFVFNDPRSAALEAVLQSASVQAVTREDCRNEWLLVLAYPQFALDLQQRVVCAARFDALITCFAADDTGANVVARTPLPRCKDTDDQKFLEAARDTGAAVLLTKDKALLTLAGRCRRGGLFDILVPAAWVAAQAGASTLE